MIQLLRLFLLFSFTAALQPISAAGAVTGIYALSQVPNAGGELRLDPDGRYDWAVSLGQVNRSSTGRWVREGDRILLTPDDPQNPSGFTRSVELSSWNDQAERRFLRADFERSWATLTDRCPLLRIRPSTYSPLADSLTADWRGHARKAAREAARARQRANAAMVQWAATREGTPSWHNTLDTATQAIAAWHEANFRSEQTHKRAGIDPPLWKMLDYPARCLPTRPPADHEPLPREWHPQIGVIVGDREARTTLIGVPLAMIFSDGAQIDRVSGPGGWVSAPIRPGTSLAAIRLSIDEDDPAPINVPVALSGSGVVSVEINPEATEARRLEPLALQIATDGSLKGLRGVYVR